MSIDFAVKSPSTPTLEPLQALRFAVFDGPKVRLMKVLIVQNKINMY